MGSASRLADARDVWGDGARVAANERSQQDRRWCRPHGPRPRGFAPTPLRLPPAEVPGGKSHVPPSPACFLLGSESSFPLAAFQMLFVTQHPGENSLVPASAQTCRALSFPELGVGWGPPIPTPDKPPTRSGACEIGAGPRMPMALRVGSCETRWRKVGGRRLPCPPKCHSHGSNLGQARLAVSKSSLSTFVSLKGL